MLQVPPVLTIHVITGKTRAVGKGRIQNIRANIVMPLFHFRVYSYLIHTKKEESAILADKMVKK